MQHFLRTILLITAAVAAACSQSDNAASDAANGVVLLAEDAGDRRGILSNSVELIRFDGVMAHFGPEFLIDNHFATISDKDDPQWEVRGQERLEPIGSGESGIRIQPGEDAVILTQNSAPFLQPVPDNAVAVVAASAETTSPQQLGLVLDITHRTDLEYAAGEYFPAGADQFDLTVPLPSNLDMRQLRLRVVGEPSEEPALLRNVSLTMRPAAPEDSEKFHVVNGDFERFHYHVPPYPWTKLGPRPKPEDIRLVEENGNHYIALKPSQRLVGVRQEVEFDTPIASGSKIIIGAIARGPDEDKLSLRVTMRYKNGSTSQHDPNFKGSSDWTSLRTAANVERSPAVAATIDLVCEEGVTEPMHIDAVRIVALEQGEIVATDEQGRLLPRAIE